MQNLPENQTTTAKEQYAIENGCILTCDTQLTLPNKAKSQTSKQRCVTDSEPELVGTVENCGSGPEFAVSYYLYVLLTIILTKMLAWLCRGSCNR